MVPSVGRTVHYTLDETDAQQVNRRRSNGPVDGAGAQVHVGNVAHAGDVLPMVIVRVWGEGETAPVNGQVVLDGNDSLWVTSRQQGEGPARWSDPLLRRT